MSSKSETLKEELQSKIAERRCDEVQSLNLPIVADSPRDADETIEGMLAAHKESYIKKQQDLSTTLTLDKTAQLSPVVDTLNKRLQLQDHLRMLRQTETTTKQPNAVLEFDMAKGMADKLAEILQAKLVWDNSYEDEEQQLLDASDLPMRYQKLVLLQQSLEYSLDTAKPATILAIDSNEVKQLESIRDKYSSLDHRAIFTVHSDDYTTTKQPKMANKRGGNGRATGGRQEEIEGNGRNRGANRRGCGHLRGGRGRGCGGGGNGGRGGGGRRRIQPNGRRDEVFPDFCFLCPERRHFNEPRDWRRHQRDPQHIHHNNIFYRDQADQILAAENQVAVLAAREQHEREDDSDSDEEEEGEDEEEEEVEEEDEADDYIPGGDEDDDDEGHGEGVRV